MPPASPSLPDREETKRDTGALRCSVGVEGKWVESKQAGGLRAVLLGKNSLSTFHLQLLLMVQEVSAERTQLKKQHGFKARGVGGTEERLG